MEKVCLFELSLILIFSILFKPISVDATQFCHTTYHCSIIFLYSRNSIFSQFLAWVVKPISLVVFHKSYLWHRSCIDIISWDAGTLSIAPNPSGVFWIFFMRCRRRASNSCCRSTFSSYWRKQSSCPESSSVEAASFALEISGTSSWRLSRIITSRSI